MVIAVIATFIIGYIAIVFEHPLKLDKTVPALLMGALCWAFVSWGNLEMVDADRYSIHANDIPALEAEFNAAAEAEKVYLEHHHKDAALPSIERGGVHDGSTLIPYDKNHRIQHSLLHHIGKVAEILIFLIGAMTIVELIDLHKGFSVITNRIRTTKKSTMLWLVGILAFFLSATLDNLAATIVLVSLLRRLVPVKEERIWFISLAVIAANAGGAWSPIGDVTTTMLWIGNRVSTLGLITHLVLPSVVCFAIPLLIASRMPYMRGNITPSDRDFDEAIQAENKSMSRVMLFVGLGALIFVPIFKTITHLPPYVGMMLGLGIVWLVSEYIHPDEDIENKHKYSAHNALSRIEMSSILFFLGILIAVASLESMGILIDLAAGLDSTFPNENVVVILLGFASALIDNVPLVAASMGMYTQPTDASLWHFIAYSAGTGGSMLIIGSAAGVAAMGMEKINFVWYLKNIAWLAFLGFIGGAAVFILTQQFMFG